ncbi:MAG: hypothetical protein K2X27_13095 [Candidatus Obscuribacterales bacterium]|nr:hypothetical protein [Candidatus Obscuribacterales bacterium]
MVVVCIFVGIFLTYCGLQLTGRAWVPVLCGLGLISTGVMLIYSLIEYKNWSLYATWIFQTAQAKAAKVKIFLYDKSQSTKYTCVIVDGSGEETSFYVRQYTPGTPNSIPSDSWQDGRVFCDPMNDRPIVVFVRECKIWLEPQGYSRRLNQAN